MNQKIIAPLRDNFTGTKRAFDLTGNWAIAYNNSLSRNVLTSNKIDDSESTTQEWIFTCNSRFTLNLSYKVSSEESYDQFTLKMNNATKITDSGDKNWTAYSEAYPAGTYTLQFVYSKDSSSSSNEDKAYISDLWIIPDNYTDETMVDTKRSVASLIAKAIDVDIKRNLSAEAFIENSRIDIKRMLTNQEYVVHIVGDTKRSKTDHDYIQNCQADTKRRIARLTMETVFSDIKRTLLLPITITADTFRQKNKDTFQANISIDAKRRLGGELWPPLELHFDHGSGDET